MSAENHTHENKLVVSRMIRATCEEVFAAWTDPQSMAEWMCPGPVQTAEAHLDVRVGGKFQINMKDSTSDCLHTGEYRLIQPPHKLVFTWISINTGNQPTLVTVDLKEVGQHCQLTLTHEQFINPEALRPHQQGWTSIVDKLSARLERQTKG